MKKLFIPLFFLGILKMLNGQITISHSGVPFTPNNDSWASCNQEDNSFSMDNRVSRTFFLTDFDIQNDFQIHKVSFAIQTILNLPSSGFPVEVNLYTSQGNYPNGTLTLLDSREVYVTQDSFHTIDVEMETLVPSGSELVMELHYNGEQIGSALWVGIDAHNDNAPSYIQAPACGVPIPTEVETLGGVLEKAKFLFSIEGEDTVLGTVNILNSHAISIFPNPVKNNFSIQTNDNIKVDKIELYDLNGRKINTYNPNVEQMNADFLAKGIYILKVESLDGKVFSQKLIKN